MNSQPTKLALTAEGRLAVRWSDGEVRVYQPAELRKACPCATCREEKTNPPPTSPTALPVLSPAEARPLQILGMKPVGNYAYTIQFSDGHDTGIYTFETLRKLGTVAEDMSPQ